jgi:hypothetical protein
MGEECQADVSEDVGVLLVEVRTQVQLVLAGLED